MVGDVLGRFQGAVVLEVGGNAGGAEGVVADAGLDAGGLGAGFEGERIRTPLRPGLCRSAKGSLT